MTTDGNRLTPTAQLLQWFEYSHLPGHLQTVSSEFHDLAHVLNANLQDGPEKTVALRKLLESKDCAVRAKLAETQGVLS